MNEAKNDKKTILVVDDAPKTREVLQRNLVSGGYTVFTSSGVADAIRLLETTNFDLVITDLKMKDASGMELIRHVKENYSNTQIMMITGYPTVEGAVNAVKIGAEEFLAKPFTEDELFSAVDQIFEKIDIRKAVEKETAPILDSRCGLIGESEGMKKVYSTIKKAADVTATVLITGESGTGKDLVARAIHSNAKESSYRPYIPVNCGGIPEQLLESELFGHVKGAFTGASETRAGFFQAADKGTIFLDEISEMSLAMQVKLLRVLQEKEIRSVGASETRRVNVRVICATNKELGELVKKNYFREDLYFRLNVIAIKIPPLRDRGVNDLFALINHFVKKYGKDVGRQELKFSDNALQVLKQYYWPGNVRELENLIQRLVVMVDSEKVDVRHLPSHMRFTIPRDLGLNRTLAEVEIEHIRNVLDSVGGNKTRAAEILGIDRKTLREKLKNMQFLLED